MPRLSPRPCGGAAWIAVSDPTIATCELQRTNRCSTQFDPSCSGLVAIPQRVSGQVRGSRKPEKSGVVCV